MTVRFLLPLVDRRLVSIVVLRVERLVRRPRFPLRTRLFSEELRTGALWPLCRVSTVPSDYGLRQRART